MSRSGASAGTLAHLVVGDEAVAEPVDDEKTYPGYGRPWGKFVRRNADPGTAGSQPWICALGCGHKYSKSGAACTRVKGHIMGNSKAVKKCLRATAEHKESICPGKDDNNDVNSRNTSASLGRAVGSAMSDNRLMLERQPDDNRATLQRLLEEERDEEERQAHLDGQIHKIPALMAMLVDKSESTKLHDIWAKAFHHAGVPPHVIEDDYFRDAIYQTSKAKVLSSSSSSSSQP